MNQDHTALIVKWVGFLSSLAMVLGAVLLYKGYQSGELLVTSGGVAGISGLVGFLGGKLVQKPTVSDPSQVPTTVTETKNQ